MAQPLSGATTRRPFHHRRTTSWMLPPSPHDRVTVSEQGVGVPPRQEVEFADGSRIWLLRVERYGTPDLFLRELRLPAGGVLVDLRKLVPELEKDLPVASSRDVPGIVHFSLRGRFGSAEDLIAAGVACGGVA